MSVIRETRRVCLGEMNDTEEIELVMRPRSSIIDPIPSSYDGEASMIRSSKILRVNRIIVRCQWIKLDQARKVRVLRNTS